MLTGLAFAVALAVCAVTTGRLVYDAVPELEGREPLDRASLATRMVALGLSSALTMVGAISILWNMWRY